MDLFCIENQSTCKLVDFCFHSFHVHCFSFFHLFYFWDGLTDSSIHITADSKCQSRYQIIICILTGPSVMVLAVFAHQSTRIIKWNWRKNANDDKQFRRTNAATRNGNVEFFCNSSGTCLPLRRMSCVTPNIQIATISVLAPISHTIRDDFRKSTTLQNSITSKSHLSFLHVFFFFSPNRIITWFACKHRSMGNPSVGNWKKWWWFSHLACTISSWQQNIIFHDFDSVLEIGKQ